MDAARETQDRIVSIGERPVNQENTVDQPLHPNNERMVSANPRRDAAVMAPARGMAEQPITSDAGGDLSLVVPANAHSAYALNMPHGGYANSVGVWDGYSQYMNPEGFQFSQVMYNENPSLVFQPGYGYNPEMLYGQYSPVANHIPNMMVDGHMYSPQQIPYSPTYYHQPTLTNVASPVGVSPSGQYISESNGENLIYGAGSYVVPYGPFDTGHGNPSTSRLTSSTSYPQMMGILGPYEQSVGQIPLHGYGLAMSSPVGGYPHAGSYPVPTVDSTFVPLLGGDERGRHTLEKDKRRERDRNTNFIQNESSGNRGPRASKIRDKNTSELSSSSGKEIDNLPTSEPDLVLYNRPDFVTDYINAKFFVIKSFSEDNIHKSIKYSVWASTPHGNKKLNAAYLEAKEMEEKCPVFLFFSVNASGQFCGVAEMTGPVDFEKDADYWQQDRWSGQFPVKWHIIKDVSNNRFRNILLQNNDNKPVTHSRDSQEVKLEQGIEMLKIFKDHDAQTSILDDFTYYDEREKTSNDRKARQQPNSATDSPASRTDDSINQISDSLAQTLNLEDGSSREKENIEKKQF